ncbi:uncharacterized protein [Nicotiana tomentosiformis]|uniref:uncharacterized protein n=1 Tax=Nicotiana tomentosiformis TaxID=4098 RepID=UPI00388CB159
MRRHSVRTSGTSNGGGEISLRARRELPPSQYQDAALALRLQREEFTRNLRTRRSDEQYRNSLALARSNLRAMASRAINNIQLGLTCCLVNILQVEVEFDNGSHYNLSAEYLRIYSPAVDSKIRSVGGEKVISGRRHVGIMSAEPIGNYGMRLLFDDLHKTGIFTWDYLYHLGSDKFTLMRNYIKTLKKHGLSRDPPRRK